MDIQPQYELHYFNVTGRGELIRLLFIVASQYFTDVRVNPPDWPALKAGNSTPWSSLPYLKVDDQILGQSKAIIRYVAHKHDLGGSNLWEQGLVDSVVEATRDILDDFYAYQFAQPDDKTKALAKLKEKTVPTILRDLDKFIAEHGKNGHAVGEKLTTADLAVYDVVTLLESKSTLGLPSIATTYPNVRKVYMQTQAHPKIVEYKGTVRAG